MKAFVFLLIAVWIALAQGGGVPLKVFTEMASGPVRVGAARIDATLPLGTPLAGYNHGQRRVPHWPLPQIKEYTTFMTGSTGVKQPTYIRALVVDNGNNRVAFVTIDAIGSDAGALNMGHEIAMAQGFTIPLSNVIFSSSHTHSGPGAISPELLWALAPATDMLVPELQEMFANSVAQALLQAEKNLQPAKIGISSGMLTTATVNRRSSISPVMHRDSIDPHLGLLRVDDANGKPIATLWNFAIHGVCYGPENMEFSSDVMGAANDIIESSFGGVSMFMNADAGDIDPGDHMCDGETQLSGGKILSDAVLATRATTSTFGDAGIAAASVVVPFGPTNLNATLSRFNNCTHGGPLDVCGLCEFLRCDLNAHLPGNWIENEPRFSAFRFDINNVKTVVVTMPGEPLLELGWWVRNDTAAMGFDITFLAGYSNNHMGYFATPVEYDVGGYESQLTFWGIDTANMVRNGAQSAAKLVAP